MARKIVLVIVEGPSDETALGLILTRLFERQAIFFHVMHEDITTSLGVKPGNVVMKVGNVIKFWADNNHFCANDFQEIIHLVDLDGAYVDDKFIIRDSRAQKVLYSENEIRCSRPDEIRRRNEDKRGNIDRLCCTGRIWKIIPYKVYYMSSNLDHVLYNKLNNEIPIPCTIY